MGLNTVLYITAETLRVCGLILHPVVRGSSIACQQRQQMVSTMRVAVVRNCVCMHLCVLTGVYMRQLTCMQIPTTADTILRRIGAPDIPDLATSALSVEGDDDAERISFIFAPLCERDDVAQLHVEQGCAPLFTKLSTPGGSN